MKVAFVDDFHNFSAYIQTDSFDHEEASLIRFDGLLGRTRRNI
jgi:hypothetical protein